MTRDDAAMRHAKEVFLDAFRMLVDGRDDDELVFVDRALRALAEELGITADFAEVEPMTAGTFRARYRAAKGQLARDDFATEADQHEPTTRHGGERMRKSVMIPIPFPLSAQRLAQVHVPDDITADEVERMVAMLRSLPASSWTEETQPT